MWRGRLRDGGGEQRLDGTWVRANFKARFLKKVLSRDGGFVHIPTGNAQERPPPTGVGDQRDGPEVLVAPGGLASATPILTVACPEIIVYHQSGADLCAAYGLASAVHAFGDANSASAIATSARAALASAHGGQGCVRCVG